LLQHDTYSGSGSGCDESKLRGWVGERQ
jgi:hypothetical protein